MPRSQIKYHTAPLHLPITDATSAVAPAIRAVNQRSPFSLKRSKQSGQSSSNTDPETLRTKSDAPRFRIIARERTRATHGGGGDTLRAIRTPSLSLGSERSLERWPSLTDHNNGHAHKRDEWMQFQHHSQRLSASNRACATGIAGKSLRRREGHGRRRRGRRWWPVGRQHRGDGVEYDPGKVAAVDANKRSVSPCTPTSDRRYASIRRSSAAVCLARAVVFVGRSGFG